MGAHSIRPTLNSGGKQRRPPSPNANGKQKGARTADPIDARFGSLGGFWANNQSLSGFYEDSKRIFCGSIVYKSSSRDSVGSNREWLANPPHHPAPLFL